MRRALHVLPAIAVAIVAAAIALVVSRSPTGDGVYSAPSTALATPAPTPGALVELAVGEDALAHAPAGRTGIATVDAMIESLVAADAAAASALAAVPWVGIQDCATGQPGPLDAAAMSAAFVSTRPPLHSAFTPELVNAAAPRDRYAVVFGRAGGGGAGGAQAARAWQVEVERERITAASSYCGFTNVVFEPQLSELDRYLLLPPEADLPQPVPTYSAPPPAGHDALDAIIGEALAGAAPALADRLRAIDHACSTAAVPPVAAPPCAANDPDGTPVPVVPVNACGRVEFASLPAARDELAALIVAGVPSLHAVAAVPDGYPAGGDALVLLTRETRPYNWTSFGLVVDGATITGLARSCGDGRPEWLYPPTVLAGPYAEAVRGEGPTWSGIPAVDRVLVAISHGDPARLLDALDPVLIGCVPVPNGIGSPPVCADGEAAGTPVPALPMTGCEIGYVREQGFPDLAEQLSRIAPRLYAVTAPSRGFADFWPLADYALLLFDAAASGSAAPYPTIAVSELGIAGLATGCDGSLTSNLLRPSPAPSFLLAPPR